MNNENLFAILQAHFPADRSRPLLLLEDGRIVSYGEAEEGSARYASLLRELGLRAGDRVAVQVEKSSEALLLYLGCLRAGLVYLPLNSAYQEAEVALHGLFTRFPDLALAVPREEIPWILRPAFTRTKTLPLKLT